MRSIGPAESVMEQAYAKTTRAGCAKGKDGSVEIANHSAAANSATALVLQVGGQRRGVAGRNRLL